MKYSDIKKQETRVEKQSVGPGDSYFSLNFVWCLYKGKSDGKDNETRIQERDAEQKVWYFS
jgi:hypothetical protein